ncbi:MAG: DUF2207 domain-containing protein [Chloroflexi bacterium]|nr:DUF2207 domain-containing protein [Chloroflexota bacterium]
MRRSVGVMVMLVLALVLVPVASAGNLASLAWNRYDVDVLVNANGTLTVTEVQTIAFTGGQSFRKGFAVIPQKRGTIDEVKVWEGTQNYTPSLSNQPYTFETSTNDDGDLEIVWYFPPTVNSTHTFTLQYTVREAILFYPDRGYDRVQWKAVAPDHDAPIAASTVTVRVPNGAPILRAGVSDDSPAVSGIAPDQLSAAFDSTGSLRSGQGIEIRIDFQHGAVAGSAPSWQFIYDLQEQYKPLIDLISLVLAALVLIGGTLLIVMRWYVKGRDPQTGLAAEYVAEPPSDLPPAVVGTLVDERADMQDILSTLIDLARRGFITMEELNTPGFMGIGSSRDFVFRRVPDVAQSSLRPYEKLVLDRVVPDDERKLSELKYKFYQHVSEIQTELYKEVVTDGLFPIRPDSVRSRWGCGGVGVVFLAIIGGVGAVLLLGDVTFAVILPFFSLGLLGVVVSAVSSAMPVKTRLGSESAAKWLAFKRYLSNITRYTKVEEATDQFDKYLPYAIAFGIERSWINRFARLDTVPVPTWYYPYGWAGHRYGPHSAMGGGVGNLGGSGVPSVQGMSDGLAGSLQNMSSGLTSMLNSASSTFSSVPQSSGRSGGGWSGGGFSGGGGGGGGSRGFG